MKLRAYNVERERTETFWEGHLRAFDVFGGVIWQIRHGSTRVLCQK